MCSIHRTYPLFFGFFNRVDLFPFFLFQILCVYSFYIWISFFCSRSKRIVALSNESGDTALRIWPDMGVVIATWGYEPTKCIPKFPSLGHDPQQIQASAVLDLGRVILSVFFFFFLPYSLSMMLAYKRYIFPIEPTASID